MPDYLVTLTDEQDAILEAQVESLNLARAAHAGPGSPPAPLTPLALLHVRIAQVLEPTRDDLQRAVAPIEHMLLPLTPAQRSALIQRIPSPALRRRIIDLLRDR